MHLATLPRDAVAYGRHHTDLPGAQPLDLSAYPQPAPMGPTPRTLREHVGQRKFGSVAYALIKHDPKAERLRAVVERARARDQRHPVGAAGMSEPRRPQLMKLREFAEDAAASLFNRLMLAVIIVMAVWIGAPIALTFVAGAL